MAYSELIKDFSRIRDYMRQFYVYGFRTRSEFDQKSARSYDNERRRVESWLSDYMRFRQEKDGKRVFLSVDSRAIRQNPLYQAFKAKTFTDRDVTLHFLLLDALAGGERLTAGALLDLIETQYLDGVDSELILDESTLRKKLREYEDLGLLKKEKRGRETVYFRDESPVAVQSWASVAAFFSEADPLGVIGSYLLDRLGEAPDLFSFKHHYILRALESEVLCALLFAIENRQSVCLTLHTQRSPEPRAATVTPLRIRASTQDGRYHLLAVGPYGPSLLRLDRILSVKPGETDAAFDQKLAEANAYCEKLWGASGRVGHPLEHIEMTVHVEPYEPFVVERLMREKRVGEVTQVNDTTWRFCADVLDAGEMLPWLRTFIGRIESITCTNEDVTNRLREDVETMLRAYEGGDGDAVS